MVKKKETVNLFLKNFDKELDDRITKDTKPTKRYFTKTDLVEKAVKQYYDDTKFKNDVLESINKIAQSKNINTDMLEDLKDQVFEITKIKNELLMDQSMLLENRNLKYKIEILYLVGIGESAQLDLGVIEKRLAFQELIEGHQLRFQDQQVVFDETAFQESLDNI